jgi:hypothetical protein
MATTITVYEDVNDVGVVESGTTITVYEMFIGVGPQGPTGATGPAGASAVAGVLPSSFVEMTTPVTVTSATLVDITGATTTITLDSTVNIAVFMDCEVSSDGVCDLGLTISINGTDHDVVTTHLFGTASDPGKTSVIHRTATPIAAGTYTVKGRFLRSSGTKTPQVDRADLLVFALQGAKGADGADGITPDAIHAATNKTTPVDADEVGIWDSISGLLNRLSWVNIKATLKTYFDTLYLALVAPGTSGNVLTSNGSAWTSVANAAANGWIAVTDTWTYASASTITVPAGASTTYSEFSKVKFDQHGVTKKGYINPTSDTLLTFYAGSDYVIEDTATYPITNIYYSNAAMPIGFPDAFNFTGTYSGGSTMTWGTITVNTQKFSIVGKNVIVYADVTGTTGGTADTILKITTAAGQLPPNPVQLYAGAVVFDSSSISGFISFTTSGEILFYKYDRAVYGLGAGRRGSGVIIYTL